MALLLQIFWIFTKIALISWGGGPASLGIMQRVTVQLNWITPDEFADDIALSNAMPGPTAPQAAAYIGYKLAGFWGAVFATLGTVVPTTTIMLIVIVAFFSYKDSIYVKAAINGVRPFVVGLLAWTAYIIGRSVFGLEKQSLWTSLTHSWDKWLIAVVAFALLVFTNISPVWFVLAAAIIGLIFYR